MAILAIFTGSVSKSQYDALRKEVKWEEDHPSGGLFHAAAFDETGGFHVVDVWESDAALGEFVGSRLMPAFQKLGLTPPDVAVYPAYNINTYPSLDSYKV